MTSHLKFSLLLTVAGCFVAMSASAKVTPITQYLGKGTLTESEGGSGADCSSKGYYKSPSDTVGAICEEVRIIGNQLCYKCHCDTEKYPFTSNDCSTIGFEAPSMSASNGCHLPPTGKTGDVKKYTTCSCNNTAGYFPPNAFVSVAQQLFSGQQLVYGPFKVSSKPLSTLHAHHDNDKYVQCVNAGLFDCANGYGKNITQETKGTITISYNTILLRPSGGAPNVRCTTSVNTITGTGLYDSTKSCLKTKTSYTTYHNKAYTHYDKAAVGVCDTSAEGCLDSAPTADCVNYSTHTVKDYNGNSLTCYKTTSCKTDGNCYGTYNSSGAYGYKSNTNQNGGLGYLNFEKPAAGNQTCLKITGCKSGSNVSNSSTTASAFQTAVNNASNTVSGTLYSASGMHGNTTDIRGYICKLATGCDTTNKYYDVTAGTDTEWLKYFVQ